MPLLVRFRETLGLKVGDEVVLRLEDRGLRLWGLTESIRESQAIVRGYVLKDRSLSDEFIRDRKREADRETMNLPVMTADRTWLSAAIPVEVRVIR